MFVKIKEFKGSRNNDGSFNYGKLERETLYCCNKYSLTVDPKNTGKSEVVFLVENGDDMIPEGISFPYESKEWCTEIYVMNNAGKTIESHVY